MYNEIINMLSLRMHRHDINRVIEWMQADKENVCKLFGLIKSENDRIGINALWCLKYFQKIDSTWLKLKQNEFIDVLLSESNISKKRILLSILRSQPFEKNDVRSDFIDFCFSKINSECEPYAVRAFCIYCAFNMCKYYPELLAEFEEYLKLMSLQPLSPGLNSAYRITIGNIKKISTRS